MAHLRILKGRRNRNIFWGLLLDEAARQHSAECHRMQAWHAGVKYDYFTSDKGEALLSEIADKHHAKGEYPHIMVLVAEAWAEHHIRDGIAF